VLETGEFAFRIAHTPEVEAERCVSSYGELACEMNKLTVAPHAVLRATHDDDHAGV